MKDLFEFNSNLYFDNNSYLIPNKDIIIEIFKDGFFFAPLNPSSIHKIGQFSSKILEDSRDFILNLFTLIDLENYNYEILIEDYIKKEITNNCSFFDLFFLASVTEANNFIINNAVSQLDCEIFICPKTEHPSVLTKFELISKEKQVFFINSDKFFNICEDEIYEILKIYNNKKIFISIMYINNETGIQNNLEKIIKKSREIHNNIIFHSDFSQAVGKIIDINIQKLKLDFISFCGYKFGSLCGSAAIIYNKKHKIKAQIIGGGQENFLRAGTENIVSIYSMYQILKSFYNSQEKMNFFINKYNEIMKFRSYFEYSLYKVIKKINQNSLKKFFIFGSNFDFSINKELSELDFENENKKRTIPVSYFAIDGITNKMMLIFLNNFDICIGTGAACSAGKDIKSTVLHNTLGELSIIECAIRISFGINNSKDDIDFLLLKIEEFYRKKL